VAVAAIEGHQWTALAEWLRAELGPRAALNAEWQSPYQRREHMAEINAVMLEFTARYTKAELFEAAQRRRIPICPVSTPQDLVHNTQLRARGYFVEAEHPVAGTLMYAGAPYHLGGAPWQIRRTAPQLGEHNDDIYGGELGLSRQELTRLREIGVI
jgi:benzylsuccinate CoA-transferase BbsE subunit